MCPELIIIQPKTVPHFNISLSPKLCQVGR